MKSLVSGNQISLAKLTTEPTRFAHNLAQTGMFDDEKLAEIIDIASKAGPSHYTLGALDEAGYGDKWQTGVIGDFGGQQVLEAIKNGRLWLQIQGIREILPAYYELALHGFDELQFHKRDFAYRNLTANILISSPAARVLCHLDCAEVVLWHIRGKKRIYLYDYETHNLLSDDIIEGVLLRETEEELPYQESWDDVAQIFDLEPGMAVNWPHFWPHRVDNICGLNVSMQTEFYSTTGLKNYGVRFANGLLRRRAGIEHCQTATTGPLALAKCGAGLTAKKLGLHKRAERKIPSRFTIDPSRSGSIRPLAAPLQTILDK